MMHKTLLILISTLFIFACSDKPEEQQKAQASSTEITKIENTVQAKGIFDYNYQVRDLENGLRVIVVPTDYPNIVSMHMPIQTGSRNEIEEGKSGFAHFFEHMMFRGTDKYPAEKYSNILKNAGGDQNAYTTNDYTNYHTTFLKDDLEQIMEMEADRFQNLKYSEEEFRTEALAVKGEYLKNSSNPVGKWLETIRDNAYQTHTYKHTTMGFLRDIEDMPNQFEYGQEFFKRWYSPEKAALIVVGDLDVEKTFAMVEKYWGGWKSSGYTVDIPKEDITNRAPETIHLEWDSPTQPWVVVSFHGPAYIPTEKDMPSIDLLGQIYFSSSSDIYQKLVVEETKVDQFFSYTADSKDPGMLYFAARLTDPSHADYVRNEIIKTLVISRTELADAKRLKDLKSNLKYSFAGGLNNSAAIAGTLARVIQNDRNINNIDELYATYDSLTVEDLRNIANKYFVDNARITLTLAHKATIAGFDKEVDMAALVAAAEAAMQEVDSTESTPTKLSEKATDTTSILVTATPSDKPEFQVIDRSSKSPLLNISLLFHTGPAFDPEGKKGVSALTAQMLSAASTGNYSYAELQKGYYPLASGLRSQIDKEMSVFRSSIHKDNFDAWYSLMIDQLLNPGWDSTDFERLKTQLKNHISTDLRGNNDEELGKEVLYSSIYGATHPYGSYNLGALNDLDALTIDDVKTFYKEQYNQANLSLGIAGSFSEAQKSRLMTDLSKLPIGKKSVLALEQPQAIKGHQAVIIEKDTMATAVSIGFPINKVRGDKDWVALWLARSWLGEHRNSSSQLFKKIREQRGMNYGDYAYIEYFPRGMSRTQPNANLGRQQQIFQMWVRPLRTTNDAHFATRTAYSELGKLIKNGLTQEQFDSSKNFIHKYASQLIKSQSRQLGYAMDSAYYGTPEFVTYIQTELDNMTLDDVNRVIRENLQMENMQFVFITKDAKELKERLISDSTSAMTYNSPKPDSVMEEDKILQELKLNFKKDDVKIIPVK
ncbi:MAG: zinc protease, partial [Enterobacterales bacterium]